MLPTPFEKFIPKAFTRDSKLTAFSDKMDTLLQTWKEDILGLSSFIDMAKIPSKYLNELGYFLSAGLNQNDTDQQKRQKINEAIAGHKRRGSWENDAKPKVDIICGGDSEIIRSFDKDDWILVGDGNTPSAYYWASLGIDGVDDSLGIALIGAGSEIEVAGNIYIDVDNSTLSAADQEALRVDMLDIVPAYFAVHFGYIDGSGIFVEYFVME